MRNLIIFTFFMASVAQATELSLESGEIKYVIDLKVPIYGDKPVTGIINSERAHLSGTLKGSDLQDGSDLRGQILLAAPFKFDSDLNPRDEHVAEMMTGDIVLQFDRGAQPIPGKSGFYQLSALLTWNGISQRETVFATITPDGPDYWRVNGGMKVDRSKYGVRPRQTHKFGDPFIGKTVSITTRLRFIKVAD